MPVIALASLVVISDLAHSGAAVKQRIFQAVRGGARSGTRQGPSPHSAIVVVDPLVEEQLGFHFY